MVKSVFLSLALMLGSFPPDITKPQAPAHSRSVKMIITKGRLETGDIVYTAKDYDGQEFWRFYCNEGGEFWAVFIQRTASPVFAKVCPVLLFVSFDDTLPLSGEVQFEDGQPKEVPLRVIRPGERIHQELLQMFKPIKEAEHNGDKPSARQ